MAREGEGKSERTRERARRMKRKDRSSSGRRSEEWRANVGLGCDAGVISAAWRGVCFAPPCLLGSQGQHSPRMSRG